MKIFTRNTLFFSFLFLLIIVFSLIVRTIGITTNHVLFLFDNGRDLLFVKKIVIDHKFLLIGPSSGGLQGYFHGVLWYYILTIPFLLGKGNPIAMTLFMATMSTLSVAGVFFILRRIGNIYAALLGSLVFGFADFSVQTSKYIWNPYPIVWLMPFYFLSLFLFVRGKKIALPLLFLLTSLCVHFEAIYGVTLLPTLIIIAFIHFLRKTKEEKRLQSFAISLALFFLPILPTFLFDLRHQFLIIKTLSGTFISGGANITHSTSELGVPLTQRLVLRSNDLYQYTINAITSYQLVNLGLLVFALLFVCIVLRKKQTKELVLISLVAITLLVNFVLFLTLKYAVWSYYWIGSTPLYVMLISYCIGSLFNYNKKLFLQIGFIGVLVFIVFLYHPWTTFTLWAQGDILPGSQTLSTEKEVVRTIFKDANGQPFSVYVQTPPVYDYVYRYLFWWKGYTIYHDYPIDLKQHITYVIREHSQSDPTGIYFKTNTLHLLSKPIQTFHFPGIVVEKFQENKPQPVDPNYFPQL